MSRAVTRWSVPRVASALLRSRYAAPRSIARQAGQPQRQVAPAGGTWLTRASGTSQGDRPVNVRSVAVARPPAQQAGDRRRGERGVNVRPVCCAGSHGRVKQAVVPAAVVALQRQPQLSGGRELRIAQLADHERHGPVELVLVSGVQECQLRGAQLVDGCHIAQCLKTSRQAGRERVAAAAGLCESSKVKSDVRRRRRIARLVGRLVGTADWDRTRALLGRYPRADQQGCGGPPGGARSPGRPGRRGRRRAGTGRAAAHLAGLAERLRDASDRLRELAEDSSGATGGVRVHSARD